MVCPLYSYNMVQPVFMARQVRERSLPVFFHRRVYLIVRNLGRLRKTGKYSCFTRNEQNTGVRIFLQVSVSVAVERDTKRGRPCLPLLWLPGKGSAAFAFCRSHLYELASRCLLRKFLLTRKLVEEQRADDKEINQ